MGLVELTKNFHTVAILGTCKNAGKTTALNKLLDQEGLAITSIGLDGEVTDVVTGTQKPRVFVRAGTLVATAETLLRFCTPTKRILVATGIPSPLGEIVVFECLDDGFVQIAGPSISAELVALKKTLFDLGAKQVLVDGALGRRAIASSAVVDGAVIATGASYHADMQKVVDDTAFLLSLYDLPKCSRKLKPSADVVADAKSGKKLLYTDGALTDATVKALSALKTVNQIVLRVDAPSKILASSQALQVFFKRGGKLKVTDSIKILAVTVNPVSAYGWQFDKTLFQQAMAQKTALPVLNVMEDSYEL